MSEQCNSFEYKTSSIKLLEMDKENNKGNAKGRVLLDIVWKVVAELKLGDSSKLFLTILEKFYDIYYSSGDLCQRRIEIIMFFLNLIEHCKTEDYDDVYQYLDKLFMSNALRNITVKSESIMQYFFLGKGDFGKVFLGQLTFPNTPQRVVAIKVGRDDSDATLLHEAKIMAGLEHNNVVKLLAFHREPSKLIMEFVEGGNLRAAVESRTIMGRGILRALYDVAAGMEYISGKKIVHRDLDSVNIFVGTNKVCKIGDFGLARYVGHNKKGQYKEKGKILVPHLAPPETVMTGVFSTKSDVWTFGVLTINLYETAENVPLQETLQRFKELLPSLIAKGVSACPRPKLCPEDLYEYINGEVLNLDPMRRPNFDDIHKKMCEISSTKSNP